MELVLGGRGDMVNGFAAQPGLDWPQWSSALVAEVRAAACSRVISSQTPPQWSLALVAGSAPDRPQWSSALVAEVRVAERLGHNSAEEPQWSSALVAEVR